MTPSPKLGSPCKGKVRRWRSARRSCRSSTSLNSRRTWLRSSPLGARAGAELFHRLHRVGGDVALPGQPAEETPQQDQRPIDRGDRLLSIPAQVVLEVGNVPNRDSGDREGVPGSPGRTSGRTSACRGGTPCGCQRRSRGRRGTGGIDRPTPSPKTLSPQFRRPSEQKSDNIWTLLGQNWADNRYLSPHIIRPNPGAEAAGKPLGSPRADPHRLAHWGIGF